MDSYRNHLLNETAFIDMIEDTMTHQIMEDYTHKPLIVIIPEGPRSITEFNLYYQSDLKERIQSSYTKIFNPLYNEGLGLLSSQYLSFLGEIGYPFIYWDKKQLPLLVRRIVGQR